MTHLERFLAVMEYQAVDRVPNWEAGVWPQTIDRWRGEGLDVDALHWDWFSGEAALGMDPREFIRYNCYLKPEFERKVLAEDAETQTFQDAEGRVRKWLKTGEAGGVSMSMDTYLRFPVQTRADWEAMKKRYRPGPVRYEPNWQTLRPAGWKARQHPLIFAPNCFTLGFYWMARVWLGTEEVSYAWYDEPAMMQDMMHFWGDFLIEGLRPVLETTTIDYICINEDYAMKTGPLLSPETYREFIFPQHKRLFDFAHSHGVRYCTIDTDGNPEALLPLMMDAGTDAIWPCERAAEQDPVRLRKTFGKNLRLWGGVDKRALAAGPAAITAHLQSLQPLIAEGGFIPTVDHTVPPDVSWENFKSYLGAKEKMLRGAL